jgi:hypothetical protein
MSGRKPVTDPGFGQDISRMCGIELDLFSEVADKNPQVLGCSTKFAAPNGGEQDAVGEDLVMVSDQIGKQLEFFWESGGPPGFVQVPRALIDR